MKWIIVVAVSAFLSSVAHANPRRITSLDMRAITRRPPPPSTFVRPPRASTPAPPVDGNPGLLGSILAVPVLMYVLAKMPGRRDGGGGGRRFRSRRHISLAPVATPDGVQTSFAVWW